MSALPDVNFTSSSTELAALDAWGPVDTSELQKQAILGLLYRHDIITVELGSVVTAHLP
jgi:hypothetical protein